MGWLTSPASRGPFILSLNKSLELTTLENDSWPRARRCAPCFRVVFPTAKVILTVGRAQLWAAGLPRCPEVPLWEIDRRPIALTYRYLLSTVLNVMMSHDYWRPPPRNA